jgi:hypothetical protein
MLVGASISKSVNPMQVRALVHSAGGQHALLRGPLLGTQGHCLGMESGAF